MRDSTDMPQLKEDAASTIVNGLHNAAPSSHLFGRMNPWSISAPLAHRRDLRRLGHDESSGSALRVKRRREFARHAVVVCAGTRKGRHEDAIRQNQRAELNGFEE